MKTLTVLLGAAFVLAGCSFGLGDLWPSLTGEEPAAPPKRVEIPPSKAEQQAAPLASEPGTGPEVAARRPLDYGQPTGTFVGAKVASLRSELQDLKANIGRRSAAFEQLREATRRHAQDYYATVAAITARLQIGTTPGNPVLVSQWDTSQSQLDRILADIAALNSLGNQVAADSAMASYLLESVRAAYGLQGAVDEDHRQLSVLEDEVNRTVVLIDRLLNRVNGSVRRFTAYVNAERRNLTNLSLAIKNGEYYGAALSNRAYETAFSVPPPSTAARARGAAAPVAGLEPGQRPLVVIRFDRKNVKYRQALYTAVSQALERRPASTFQLVAVAPNKGTPAEVALATNEARQHAKEVFQALTEMGLPEDRIALATRTSPGVATEEVHLYVR